MKNEERTKNDLEVDHGRNSVAPQPCFSLFSSSFLWFLSILDLWTSEPPSQPLFTLAKKKNLLSWQLAQASCYFILKQPCSPERAGYFTMKLFSGPGEPGASLDKPGVIKSFQMTLLPSFLGIFRILFRNVEKPFKLHGNWCLAAQFG